MFGMSHKTVYVLDHSSRMAVSSKQSLDLDVFTKGRVPGIIPLAPIAKSLWTCVVESAMEYCRILYDIFPTKKLVRRGEPSRASVPNLCILIFNFS